MEVDLKLKYSNEQFATELLKIKPFKPDKTFLNDAEHPMRTPHPSAAVLAQFANVAYAKDVRELPSGWKILTTAINTSNGYFGAAFYHSTSQQVVLAHRGTANIGSAKDDLDGVILNHRSAHMKSAATFADKVKCAIIESNKASGKSLQLSITGHSLGGWLAQTSGFSVKFLQADDGGFIQTRDRSNSLHAHIVAFESPGCKAMLEKIVDSYYPRHGRKASFEALDISSYLSAPNLINTFGRHVGSLYRVMIDVSNFGRLERKTFMYTIETHKMNNLIKAFADNKDIIEMEDWPAKRSTEYKKFHQKVDHPSEYHLDLNNYDDGVMKERYQNKKCPDGRWSGSLRMFSADELKLLEFWIIFKRETVRLNKIQTFLTEHHLGGWKELFVEFSIDTDNRTVTCDSEGHLDQLVWRTKLLMRWFSAELMNAVKEQSEGIPTIVYYMASKNYLDSLPECALDFTDCIGLRDFLQSDRRILEIESDDCVLEMLRLSSVARQLRKSSSDLDDRVQHECQTFLHWKHFVNLQLEVDIENLPENFTRDNLLVIDCGSMDVTRVPEIEAILKHSLKNNNKKLILVSSHQMLGLMSFEDVSVSVVQAGPFESSQLTEDSQKNLFTKNILDIGDANLSIADFIGETNFKLFSSKINTFVDTKDLKEILRNKTRLIKMENSRPNLINFGVNVATIGRKVSVDYLTKTASSDGLLVISGNPREEVSTQLTILATSGSVIRGNDGEEKFKQTISENPNKKVYWVEANDSSTTVKQIYHQSFYMTRRFHHQTVLKVENFKVWREVEDTLVFQGVPNKPSLASLLRLSKTESGKFEKKENILVAPSDQEVEDILERNDYKKPVHVLKLETSDRFLWQRSLGSLEGLRPDVYHDTDSAINEEQLCNMKRKVVIIADEPGMGKSTSLASVSGLLHSDPANWLIWIDLKHFKIPTENVPTDRIRRCELLLRVNLTGDSLSRDLLQLCLHQEHPRQVYVMFDGFDELRKDYSSEALDLLTYLGKETKARVWVTTRFHERILLENILSTFAVTFEKINGEFQRDYLENYWRTHLLLEAGGGDEKLQQCARDLYAEAEKVLGGNIQKFMGIPLQLRMLAEVFLEEVNKCVESPDEYERTLEVKSVFSLYEQFIRVKYNIYCKKKIQLNVDTEDRIYKIIVDDFTKSHRKLGFCALFPESAKLYHEDSESEGGADLCRVGLVQAWGGGEGDAEFIHRTLAEYFCADHIVHRLSMKCRCEDWAPTVELLLTSILVQDPHKVIRMFIDNFLLLLPDTARADITLQTLKLWGTSPAVLTNPATRQTALHVAAREGHTRIAHFLTGGEDLLSEPNQNGLISFIAARGEKGRTALHYAALQGHLPIVQCLVEKGGDINLFDENGWAALHCAARWGHLPIVQWLVEKEANINSADENGSTALHYAARWGHLPIVQWLVEKGRDINSADNTSSTALHYATRRGHLPIVQWLVEKGGDINLFDKNGWAALHCAAREGHLPIVQWLVEKEANINSADKNGSTALHYAARWEHHSIVQWLVEKEGDINSVDKDGSTALHIAAREGYLQIVQYLVKRGDINSVDENGRTALHYAAHRGHLPLVQWLVEKEGNINSADNTGRTALDYAARQEHFPIVKYLEEKGRRF